MAGQTRAEKRAAAPAAAPVTNDDDDDDNATPELSPEALQMLELLKDLERPRWEVRREARKPYKSIGEDFHEAPITVIFQVLGVVAGCGVLAWLSSLM